MSLDFVLAHAGNHFLATEQEKVDYFTNVLQIAISTLPTKRYRSKETGVATARHFVDKYPMLVPAAPSDSCPVVSFCFVDEGLTTASRFETYLQQYGPLFAALPQVHVIYVAATAIPFRWAEKAFERFVTKLFGRRHPLDPLISRMMEHFDARKQFESKHLESFDKAKLIRFRDEREEFSGEKVEALYERWKRDGEHAVLGMLAPETNDVVRPHVTFSTHLLRHNYDLFGTLTAF